MSLPLQQQEALCHPRISYVDSMKRVAGAIDENSKLASAIADHGSDLLSYLITDDNDNCRLYDKDDDAIARSTLRQLYRDFSEEGSCERDICHDTILHDLTIAFAGEPREKRRRILVPGAGLLRLPLMLHLAEYAVEANEVSHHHLLASLYMLNHAETDPQHTLYPWALSFSNHLLRSHQYLTVPVPDIWPKRPMVMSAEAETSLKINMNDFVVEYAKPCYQNAFDAVATLFFIDTARNLLDHIATIRNCLEIGGVWINVGPLLWNCNENGPPARGEGDIDDDISCKIRHGRSFDGAGDCDPQMLEFSDDQVLALLEHSGFDIEVQDHCIGEAGFIANPKSMLQNTYRLSHWVARKKR